MRMLVLCADMASDVSRNARVTIAFRRAFTSSSFQKYSWRP